MSGCPACPHAMGYHVNMDGDRAAPHRAPKPSDPNLYCVWCEHQCVTDGAPRATTGVDHG
jgi:hypothetical protein